MRIDYKDAIREKYTTSLMQRHVVVIVADLVPEESPALRGKNRMTVEMQKLENQCAHIFNERLRQFSVERLWLNNFLTIAIGTDELEETPDHHALFWKQICSGVNDGVKEAELAMGLALRVGISSVHRNIGNIYDAYQETHAIMEHFGYLSLNTRVVTVEDIMGDIIPDRTQRLALEKQWFAFTAAYQFGKAKEVLCRIVELKTQSMRTAVTIRMELISRLNYMVYFICDCEGVNHSVRTELQNKLQTIWATKGKDTLFSWIDQIYAAIEQIVTMDQRDIAWSERFIQYIRSNYMDTELDVNVISGRFGLNASYVSHVFRESTGIRLLDYIHSVRIEHICRLLSTELPLIQIAKMTGYRDVRSMSRVFTRYMEMTPTQYRRLHSRA